MKLLWFQSYQQAHLLVNELSGVLLYVSFIQVGCHIHEADFGEPEISEFNMSHGSDQETAKG